MKKNIALKVLISLLVLVVCLISFVGIYVKNNNTMKNIVPDFLLGMNLEGGRVVLLTPNTSTKEVIYDSEGKVTTEGKDDEGNLKEGYTKKDELINKEEVLTKENYQTMKNIIENRLKNLGIQEYIVRLEEENGQIAVELPDNTQTDSIISDLVYVGKFEIQDADTKEVLLDNSNVKQAKAVYGSGTSGTSVYLNIEFTKEGKAKLEEISKTYIETTDEEGNATTKKININLDDSTLKSTYFGETITTGILQLSVGYASTKAEDLKSYSEQAGEIATLIDSGKMPITYKVSDNRYMETTASTLVKIVGIVGIAILAIVFLYFIFKYRIAGILASISSIGFIALLFIILRYTNVIMSLETMVAIGIIVIANLCFIARILKQREETTLDMKQIVNQTYLRNISILMPLLIVAVTFAFVKWIPIASIGMVMFWGIFVMIIYHYIVTRTLLLNQDRKAKE